MSRQQARSLAVAAVGLALLTLVPANYARVQWSEGVCDHSSVSWCPDQRVVSRQLSGEGPDYTRSRTISLFEASEPFEFVTFGAGICECGLEPLDLDENVKVHVEGPGGRVYGPWYLTYHEPCHSCHTGFADSGSPGGSEQIVVVAPPVGTYALVLEPGPDRSDLPDRSNLAPAGAAGFYVKANDPILLGNNIWWYYPDGSRVFVEDGGYVSSQEASRTFLGYAAATAGVGALAVLAGYRAWRLSHPGSLYPLKGVLASASGSAVALLFTVAAAGEVLLLLGSEDPHALSAFGEPEFDLAWWFAVTVVFGGLASLLAYRTWRLHARTRGV